MPLSCPRVSAVCLFVVYDVRRSKVDTYNKLAQPLPFVYGKDRPALYDNENDRYVCPIPNLPKPKTIMCKTAVDLMFVLDASGSVTAYHFFNTVIPFVKGVVKQFDIGLGNTQSRVAVSTYSSDAVLNFQFGAHSTVAEALAAIDGITYPGGWTKTAEALGLVRDQMVPQLRANTSSVLILITDGVSQDSNDIPQVAKEIQDQGTQIYSLGVGTGIDYQELALSASQPSEEHVFEATFANLGSFATQISQKACGLSTVPKHVPVNALKRQYAEWNHPVAMKYVSLTEYDKIAGPTSKSKDGLLCHNTNSQCSGGYKPQTFDQPDVAYWNADVCSYRVPPAEVEKKKARLFATLLESLHATKNVGKVAFAVRARARVHVCARTSINIGCVMIPHN